MRGPLWALLLFLLPRTESAGQKVTIPGCPSVDVLENDDRIDANTLKNLLLCFCEATTKKNVAISCFYSSNPDHLKRATDAVKAANMTTNSIHIQHMDFPESGLPPLGEMAPELRSLEIRECSASSPPLVISPDAFKGLEDKLQNVTINSCNMLEVPTALDSLTAVRNLDLSANKLMSLEPALFANKKQLTYLDISSNQLSAFPEGTFAPLEELETLVAGDHNYMNESFLEEIGTLKKLKTLDLSRADGIFEPPMALFNSIPKLEELKLSGCSIVKLDPGVFSPLRHLKMLDLRVNLIENVSAYSFDGLSRLERLTLAGNYIRDLEKDVWSGLDSLKELDIGWNELKQIPPYSLASLDPHLVSLNLRHNPLTAFPATGLTNLEELLLSENELTSLDSESLAEYKHLQKLDLSGCNLTNVEPDSLKVQKDTLKVLNLSRNHLKNLSPGLLEELPQLEELDVSRNPLICDDRLAKFISAIEDRYKMAAKEGKEFLLSGANETLCARPYPLKGQEVFEVDSSKLETYDESADTTTTSTPATTAAFEEDDSSTTPFVIPNLFIGSKTNETLFKEEPRRDVYDLSKADNVKGSGEGATTTATLLWSAGILGVISLISLTAVILFIKKRRSLDKVAPDNSMPKKSPAVVEDGMEEIELNTRS